MATPPAIDNDQLPLATHCLEFTKALVMQGISFTFSITAGPFAFSFDTSNGKRNSATARSPARAGTTRKSPSTLRRNARRRELFLKKKSENPSSIPSSQIRKSPSTLKRNARRRELFLKKKSENSLSIPSSQTKTTHPQSQAHCPPSADSTDIENTVIQQNGDWISHPRSPSPINQFDGTSDPCDKVEDHSQLSDTYDDNQILCAMCNLKMTPTHQCCVSDKTQLKSEYDKFMQKCEEGLVAGLKACNSTHLIEGALNNHRLRYDFETWQRM